MGSKRRTLYENQSLNGKTVAITGSTGGIGLELCRALASLGADLILLNRSYARSEQQVLSLQEEFPTLRAEILTVDMEQPSEVKAVTDTLKNRSIDALILNAGAYHIPRKTCETGFDNVFQINFVSPYYMARELMPQLLSRKGKVVAVGSIAHNYSKIDPNDVDFSTYRASSKVYGNAKRHLMYGLLELFRGADPAALSITHPGITFTNITAHYPRVIFAVIKHPMKIIFMKPQKAALSILAGLHEDCSADQWIGPRWFDVWGLPRKKALKTASRHERAEIARRAEQAYEMMKNLPNEARD